MKKLAIFDIDGTVFRWQLYHEFVFGLKDRRIFDEDTADRLDTALIEWQSKKRSWHEYEGEIIKAFEPVINRVDLALFNEVAHNVTTKSGHKVYAYTTGLIKKLKKEGYYILAISGSQQELVDIFAKQFGFDDCIGVLYETVDGKFTGNISRRVPGRKHEIIQEYLQTHPELTLKDSFAVGDSDGDISMLKMVDNPIAFNPSHELIEVAQTNGWDIVVERKNIAYTIRKNSDGLFVLEKADQL